MSKEKLNFGIIIRVFVSLLPILFGMPTLATIFCAYNIAMSFIIFGPLTAFVSSLCSIGISMFLASSYGPAEELSGLVWGIQAILCGAGCIYGIFSIKDFYYGLGVSTLGIVIPQIIYTQHRAHSDGMTVVQMLVPKTENIKLIINDTIGSLQLEEQKALQINDILVDKMAATVENITTMLIPSALIIVAMVIAYVVMWAVSVQLRRLPFGGGHSFSHIKVTRTCVLIIPILLLLVISGIGISNSLIIMVSLNMIIVLLSMCFFAGISLVDFYIRRFIPFMPVRVILHALVALNAFPVYILAAFADSFANFRKLPVAVNKKGGEAHETKE